MAEDQQEQPQEPAPKSKLRRLKWLLAVLVVVAAAGVLYLHFFAVYGPVPQSIQKSVSFQVYYPQAGKLPAGYRLDTGSFRLAESGVVLFSVSYGSGRSMVFSEVAEPGGDVVSKFVSSAIPINNTLSTPVGKAMIGAYGTGKSLRTLASLPITKGPWLIVTAPSDINQDDLGKVLNSLTK